MTKRTRGYSADVYLFAPQQGSAVGLGRATPVRPTHRPVQTGHEQNW